MRPKGDGLLSSLDPVSEERAPRFSPRWSVPDRQDSIGLAEEGVDLFGSPTPIAQLFCRKEFRCHGRL